MTKKKMKKKLVNISNTLEEFELLSQRADRSFVLTLYVSGNTPNSEKAILNLKKICEENLKGRYTLEVIDLYQKPGLAKEVNVIAVPTVIKRLPLPLRRVIGDMSDKEKVLIGLDIQKIARS